VVGSIRNTRSFKLFTVKPEDGGNRVLLNFETELLDNLTLYISGHNVHTQSRVKIDLIMKR